MFYTRFRSMVAISVILAIVAGRSSLAADAVWKFDGPDLRFGALDGQVRWRTYTVLPTGDLAYAPGLENFSVAGNVGSIAPVSGDGLLSVTSQSAAEGSAPTIAINFSQVGGADTPSAIDDLNSRVRRGANALQLSVMLHPIPSVATALIGGNLVGAIPSDPATERILAGFAVRPSDRRLFLSQWLSAGQLGVTQSGNYYIQTAITVPAGQWSMISVEWNVDTGLVRYRVGSTSGWLSGVQSATVSAQIRYLALQSSPAGATQQGAVLLDDLAVSAVCREGGSTTPEFDCDQNGIGDWCEVVGSRFEAAPGTDAVRWAVSAGGNDHWYWYSPDSAASWSAALDRCEAMGASLVTVEDFDEMMFLSANQHAPGTPAYWWSGAVQAAGAAEPWGSREPSEIYWAAGEPNNGGSAGQNQIEGFGTFLGSCDTCTPGIIDSRDGSKRFICEWGFGLIADCNRNDRPDSCDILADPQLDCDGNGRIDLCDIERGDVADCDTNGVPDLCDIANGGQDVDGDGVLDLCDCAADLFVDGSVNGADLGILLSQWGPVARGGAVADLNRDGFVNGADLGVLLSRWGPCPQG
jgi:hypothetical protein